ncbi:MAG: transcription antitermination factor NusB [Clostridiales Family XIII bacterium]|jgi:N utilization substance protein B|nr:transcription antitermination factor NusB [Clostridiales Family XIII bacterium]
MRANKRSRARETLMQMLFQMDAQGDFSVRSKDAFLEAYLRDKSLLPFANLVFEAAVGNMGEIDAAIAKSSDNWKLSRMARADLAILRLAAAEIFFVDDIPVSVSANEAVELAKKFGGENSSSFVNGVLGRMIRGDGDADPAEGAEPCGE